MPKGIYNHKSPSEETKRKMSERMKGNKHTLGFKHTKETKRKISEAGIGHKLSEEIKRKIGESLKGNKNGLGFKHTEETKRKMSEAKKGIKRSEETKRKMSEAKKGIKRSEETKRKISEAFKGSNHPNWQNGISFLPYSQDWTKTLKLLIRQRDNFTCQRCGITEQEHIEKLGRVLSVNHIDYNKMNCNPKNLNTLCLSCNSIVNYNREYWTKYFQEKMNLILC